MTCDDPRTRRVVDFFETLAPQTLHQLPTVYADDVHFKDPFNAIRGHAPLMAIFQHMFDGVQHPRFVVTEAICQGDQAFLVWDFHFERQGLPSPMAIHGSTHIREWSQGNHSSDPYPPSTPKRCSYEFGHLSTRERSRAFRRHPTAREPSPGCSHLSASRTSGTP